MKKFLTAMAILACAALPALAGPNAGGTILVHYAPVTVPGEPMYVDGGLTNCDAAVTMAPPVETIMWFAYAAFPENSAPRLKVVTFGCEFNNATVAVLWYATRPGALEIFYPDQSAWPYTGSGVAVGFETTLTDIVNEIYCFAGYGYQDEIFALVPHPDPNLGGSFADDNVPSQVDMIAGYGTMGFGVAGVPACPPPAVVGACCYEDGRCEFGLEETCGGAFLPDVQCDPNPCPAAFACCFGEDCRVLTADACTAQGGLTMPDLTCDPNPCISPTENTTWGQIKNTYR